MNPYIILTDSSCDLPQWKLEELGVHIACLTTNMEGKTYINDAEWREISPSDFYNALRAGKDAKTSAANVDDFKTLMTPVLEEGKDILYIGFSSGLSGTYNAGRLAAEELAARYPDRKIRTVDSLSASLGQGLLVALTCEKRDAGATLDEAADYCEEIKLKICHWFTVDDLHFLHRGGRVSKSVAVIGSALGIKPVMYMDNEGHLTKKEVRRGRKASIRRLAEWMENTAVSRDVAYISHGDCADEAAALAKMLKEELGVGEVLINVIGPVIGSHSGPGTMALFFVGTGRE